VGEDARRDRIYLPLDELRQFKVNAEDILRGRATDRFTELMQFQIERAREYYERAFAALPAQDRRSQRPGLVMAGIYQRLLNDIATKQINVLTKRASMTPIRKLWIAWRTWRRA